MTTDKKHIWIADNPLAPERLVYEFNDLDTTCRDAGQICFCDESGDDLGQIKDRLFQNKSFTGASRVLLDVVVNAPHPALQECILPLSPFIESHAETVDVIFGVSFNDRVKPRMYNVIAIASGYALSEQRNI